MTPDYSSAYWMAVHIGDELQRKKLYFDMPLHDGNFSNIISKLNEWFPGFDIPGADFLENISRDPRVLHTGSLCSVQARLTRYSDPERDVIELKGYFQPRTHDEFGVRCFVQAIRRALPDDYGKMLSGLPGLAAQITAKMPVYYISLAQRPDLEVEFYHDVENVDFGETPEEIVARACDVFGEGDWQNSVSELVRICVEEGMKCTHASHDVYPDKENGNITLLFDLPEGKNPRHALRSVLTRACDAAGLEKHPQDIWEKGSLSEGRVPFAVGISAPKHGTGKPGLTVEELAPVALEYV
jgi:hypothetical protein